MNKRVGILCFLSVLVINLIVVCSDPIPHQPAPTVLPTATSTPTPEPPTPTLILAGPPATKDKAPTLTFTPAPPSTTTPTATQAMPAELPRAGG